MPAPVTATPQQHLHCSLAFDVMIAAASVTQGNSMGEGCKPDVRRGGAPSSGAEGAG